MKGIILAGGSGSRLYPITNYTSKQLLPVYNKPMIFYPLSTLMLAGVKDILIICKKIDLNSFKKLLGNGSYLGIKINYEIQKKPSGIAEALKIGKNFIKKSDVYLILGDNIFYGAGLQNYFDSIHKDRNYSYIFGSYVNNPKEFGIVNKLKHRLKIEEKPKKPKSNIAVTGLYFYPNKCLKHVNKLKRSKRGELEITDLNDLLSQKKQLKLFEFGRGFAWFDCGTATGLLEAASFIKTVETIQGLKIGCPEEVAIKKKYINKKKLNLHLSKIPNSEYKNYLKQIS
jgi:glucose-1-phosphate thymidylyltransferase